MGSLLYGKSIDQWHSILERYERAPASNIHEILKITKKEHDLQSTRLYEAEKLLEDEEDGLNEVGSLDMPEADKSEADDVDGVKTTETDKGSPGGDEISPDTPKKDQLGDVTKPEESEDLDPADNNTTVESNPKGFSYWIFLIISLIQEIISSICDQFSSSEKPKQKVQANQPSQPRVLPATIMQVKPEPPSQIVPFHGCSPIQVSNRFTSLGSTVNQVRPNYQSALVSSYDPFQVPVRAQPSHPVSQMNKSPYVFKSKSNLFVIEPCYDHLMSNPAKIAEAYFPLRFHFIPLDPSKSLSFYRDILIETESVEIKPIKDRNDPNIIPFHSIYIRQILSQSEWGVHPFAVRTLGSSLQYSYYDYIEAWYKIFLHQFPDFSHAWFINFDNKFKSQIPFWFAQWWESHGPIADILPFDLVNTVDVFATKYKFSQHELYLPQLLIFSAKYKVPWILKWSYQVNKEVRILSRQFTVKWWDKFEVERVINQVQKEFSAPCKQSKPKPGAPGSSHSSLPVEGKTKSELRELANMLIMQASQMEDDAASPKSESSQVASSTQHIPSSQKKPSTS